MAKHRQSNFNLIAGALMNLPSTGLHTKLMNAFTDYENVEVPIIILCQRSYISITLYNHPRSNQYKVKLINPFDTKDDLHVP